MKLKKTDVLLLAVAVAVAGGVAWYFLRDAASTEEDRVRRVIEGLAESIESDNPLVWPRGIRSRLADDYRHTGEGGGFAITRQAAVGYVARLKQAYGDFKADIREIKITVTGEHADAIITGRVTAAPKDSPGTRQEVMTRGSQNRAAVKLRKDDGEWLVIESKRVEHRLE